MVFGRLRGWECAARDRARQERIVTSVAARLMCETLPMQMRPGAPHLALFCEMWDTVDLNRMPPRTNLDSRVSKTGRWPPTSRSKTSEIPRISCTQHRTTPRVRLSFKERRIKFRTQPAPQGIGGMGRPASFASTRVFELDGTHMKRGY